MTRDIPVDGVERVSFYSARQTEATRIPFLFSLPLCKYLFAFCISVRLTYILPYLLYYRPFVSFRRQACCESTYTRPSHTCGTSSPCRRYPSGDFPWLHAYKVA